MILKERDIKFVPSDDEVGAVFYWEDRVFRAINTKHEENVRNLISSDLYVELTQKKLFPETTISNDIEVEGYSLILEHKKIPCISLPCEWSYNMAKDAALAYLQTFQICIDHGYTLKDGHLHNLAFFNNKPIYFDLGSIIPGNYKIGLYEFYYAALLPLQIWSLGDFYLANLILRDDYLHKRFLPSIPLTDQKVLQSIIPLSQKKIPRYSRLIASYILRKIFRKSVVSESPMTCELLMKKVTALEKKKYKTSWSNYHNEYINGAEIESTSRFDRLISIINDLHLDSMIDLAGNKGVFSLLIADKTNISRVICSDYDEMAIDDLYLYLKHRNNTKIIPILLNFMYPISNFDFGKVKSDIVVALAVTHHLLLTQKCPIDSVFKKIGQYSNRYVLIEFMPLGLWNGYYAPPIPEWHNLDWFREKFKRHFKLLIEEQTEKNRILFLGEHYTS
jgi:hypothetical protein